ncbi:MAG TPA: STAS domain-containing protein [Prolixibacteraceae bacterium]
MNVEILAAPDYTLVSVVGRVDTTNANEFEKSMMGVVEGGSTKIVLDCAGLDYISSSGLRVFLIVQKKMMAIKGKFALCCLQPEIQEIFDISGFSSIFSIFSDQDAAIKG